MTSLPLSKTHNLGDRIHNWKMLGVACPHGSWATHTIVERRASHAIIYLGYHIQSNDVERVMLSSSFDITHCWTTSVMERPHVPWAGNTGGRRRVWHAIIAMDNIQGQTMSRVACYHCPWTEHKVRWHRAWHAIIYLGLHIGSRDVERVMLSTSLGFILGRMT